MMPDPRFDPNYDGPMMMMTEIFNSHKTKPLTIMSGEFEHLNKKVLMPGKGMKVTLEIPKGFREFLHEDRIMGKNVLYVGLRDEAAAEPFFHRPSL